MLASAVGRLLALLDHPRVTAIAVAAAVVLCVPALGGGLVADDWFHRASLASASTLFRPGRGALLEMFNFFPADQGFLLHLRDVGMLPWWVDPDIRGGFLRPLSAATHWVDWTLVGNHPVLHHAHSLLWLAACVASASLFFRAWLGAGRVAALATLLFAIDDAHAWPASWIANRNSLVAMTFGLLAGWSYLRAREGRSRRLRVAAIGFFAGALLAAEAGAAAGLLLFSMELWRPEPWSHRARRLAPFVGVGVLWMIAWKLGGYGISGSGLYVDPFRSPVRFAGLLPERLGALTGALWWNLGVDFWVFLPEHVSLLLGLTFGVVGIGALWYVVPRGRPSVQGRQALAVAFLCLLPPCAAFPMERVLTFAGIGAAAFLALLLTAALEGGLVRWRDRAVLLWHVPLSALVLLAKAVSVPAFMGQLGSVAEAVPTDPSVAHAQLVIVSGLEITTAYIPVERELRGIPAPAAMAVLAPASARLTVTREDDRTLRLDAAEPMFRHAIERLCREAPLPAGTEVSTDVVTVRVLADDGEGHPTSLRATFPTSLDSPLYRWLGPETGALVPFEVPAVGQSVSLGAYLPLPSEVPGAPRRRAGDRGPRRATCASARESGWCRGERRGP